MIEEGLDIGDGNGYEISTPHDLLLAANQRIELHRIPGLYVHDFADTALVGVTVAWKGFRQVRTYSVPWTGTSGYATVFPDFGQLGYRQLWALYTEAEVSLTLDGEELTSGNMRVASQPAREFDTLDLGEGDCPFRLYWLDRRGTRFSVPVVSRSVSHSGKAEGYSPSYAYSTRAGQVSEYRQWQPTQRSVTFETLPLPAQYEDYLGTLGETPFHEIRDMGSDAVLLYDGLTTGGVTFGGGLVSATITIANLRDPLP